LGIVEKQVEKQAKVKAFVHIGRKVSSERKKYLFWLPVGFLPMYKLPKIFS